MTPAEIPRQQFASEETEESFPNAPLQEVTYEVRFAPKLRIASEIWKLQENLATSYPSVRQENALGATGITVNHVFETADGHNRVVASQGNFAILMKQYPGFHSFLNEAVSRTEKFCSIYEIGSFNRVGLRYMNQFLLPGGDRLQLGNLVNHFIDFRQIDIASTSRFVVELKNAVDDHVIHTRTALLDEPTAAYVLDIDCYSDTGCSITQLRSLLSKFHQSAKAVFLQHFKPALKEEFRRRPK